MSGIGFAFVEGEIDMDILIAFLIGSFAGCSVMAFMNGCANTNKINEAYMEGYLEGQRYAGNGKWN